MVTPSLTNALPLFSILFSPLACCCCLVKISHSVHQLSTHSQILFFLACRDSLVDFCHHCACVAGLIDLLRKGCVVELCCFSFFLVSSSLLVWFIDVRFHSRALWYQFSFVFLVVSGLPSAFCLFFLCHFAWPSSSSWTVWWTQRWPVSLYVLLFLLSRRVFVLVWSLCIFIDLIALILDFVNSRFASFLCVVDWLRLLSFRSCFFFDFLTVSFLLLWTIK